MWTAYLRAHPVDMEPLMNQQLVQDRRRSYERAARASRLGRIARRFAACSDRS
jgi:hypothetical protein